MERPKSHEVDTLADAFLRSALSPGWAVREQKPDYGIDYEIELTADGHLTGTKFAVQLKGSEQVPKSRECVTYALKTKALSYYVDDCRLPVFLVLVDVTTEQGYWCFLQQYALERLAEKPWKKQTTVTIRVPIEQSLEDIASLEAAVRKAEKYMTELRPGSMEAAARAEKLRIESIDPRLTADVSFQNGHSTVHLSANENIEFHMTASGDDAVQELQDLVERGVPANFQSDEMELTGSPLFKSIAGEIKKIEWKHSIDSDFVFVAIDGSGDAVAREVRLNGKLEGGQKERRYHGEIADAPLVTRYDWRIGDPQGVTRLEIESDIGRWKGQRISRLAYFTQLDSFFGALADGALAQTEGWAKGNKLFAGTLEREELLKLPLCGYLQILRKAREITRLTDVDPTFPGRLTLEQVVQVEELFDLLTVGVHRRSGHGFSITFSMSKTDSETLVSDLRKKLPTGRFAAELGVKGAAFLGEEVHPKFKRLKLSLSDTELVNSIDDLESQMADQSAQALSLTFKGVEGCELTMTVVD